MRFILVANIFKNSLFSFIFTDVYIVILKFLSMGLIIVLVSEIKHGQINVMTKSRQHFFFCSS